MALLSRPRTRRPPATRLSVYLVVAVGLTAAALITGDGGGEAAASPTPGQPVTQAQLRDCLRERGVAARLRGSDEVVAPVSGAAIVLRVHPSAAAALASVGARTVALPGSAIRLSPVDNNVSWRPAEGLPVGAYAGIGDCFAPPPPAAWRAPAAALG